jgi:hypothetical protein
MMRKVLKIVAAVLVALFLGIQFIPSEKPLNGDDRSQDLMQLEQVQPEIAELLINGCYDCHSEAVNYPWYSSIAPVSWLVFRDVRVGREELNFSQWGQLSRRKKIKLLTSVGEQLEEEEMPLPVYLILHPEARFDDDQRAALIAWADDLSTLILEE